MPAATSNNPKLRSTAKPPRSPRTPRSHSNSRSSSRCSSSNSASSPLFHRDLLPLVPAEKSPRRFGRSRSLFPRLQHRLSYSILIIARVFLTASWYLRICSSIPASCLRSRFPLFLYFSTAPYSFCVRWSCLTAMSRYHSVVYFTLPTTYIRAKPHFKSNPVVDSDCRISSFPMSWPRRILSLEYKT